MNSLTAKLLNVSKYSRVFGFWFGVLLLFGSWSILYELETMFAESHLASYYCCLMPQDLLKIGTLEQTVSNFFRASPGRDLVGVVFVLVNVGIFVSALRKAPKTRGSLPLLFAFFNMLYAVISVCLCSVSWAISDAIVGPMTTPYKGYQRTWYGIVLHFALWAVFFYVMKKQAARQSLINVELAAE